MPTSPRLVHASIAKTAYSRNLTRTPVLVTQPHPSGGRVNHGERGRADRSPACRTARATSTADFVCVRGVDSQHSQGGRRGDGHHAQADGRADAGWRGGCHGRHNARLDPRRRAGAATGTSLKLTGALTPAGCGGHHGRDDARPRLSPSAARRRAPRSS